MVYSLVIWSVLDFLPKKELLRVQCLQKYIYNRIIPSYFGNKEFRRNVLGQMKIPEYHIQNAVLFFQDDAEGTYYTLN